MLLPASLVIIGITFPLVTLSAPIKCPPGAPCIPDPWREDPAIAQRSSDVELELAERSNPFSKPVPGPTFPDPPMHQDEEKRQAPTKPWSYYGYPAPQGPVKIERSADPDPNPLDESAQSEKRQAPTKTWPYYGYPVERPVKIERSAITEPDGLDAASQAEKRQTNELPTWPYTKPPSKPSMMERSVESEADQSEKRQATTGQWPYYGYPVKPVKGPVKIERSASPGPAQGPTEPDPEHGIPHPHYVYADKRSAQPEAEPAESEVGPWGPHPPPYGYPDPAPANAKREAAPPSKLPGAPGGSNGGGPRYLYQDPEKRAAATSEEAPKSTPSATPFYGYRVPEKRSVDEEAPKSTPTATPYYGYRVPEKRGEAPESTTTATPYYGYRVPESDE